MENRKTEYANNTHGNSDISSAIRLIRSGKTSVSEIRNISGADEDTVKGILLAKNEIAKRFKPTDNEALEAYWAGYEAKLKGLE